MARNFQELRAGMSAKQKRPAWPSTAALWMRCRYISFGKLVN